MRSSSEPTTTSSSAAKADPSATGAQQQQPLFPLRITLPPLSTAGWLTIVAVLVIYGLVVMQPVQMEPAQPPLFSYARFRGRLLQGGFQESTSPEKQACQTDIEESFSNNMIWGDPCLAPNATLVENLPFAPPSCSDKLKPFEYGGFVPPTTAPLLFAGPTQQSLARWLCDGLQATQAGLRGVEECKDGGRLRARLEAALASGESEVGILEGEGPSIEIVTDSVGACECRVPVLLPAGAKCEDFRYPYLGWRIID
ncbi:unnamed protein product [Vitrella brassicaformis CCMP3155]|uniref:Uncharacterized protein n=1 Tax=Vitrella brassicaformis (strain CCMP3155) TaxID=1169540 RepID=A0A0G4EW19_VITBC|nr:unnamed protein product [Vitrella brassicaformis CCMP3155]|mmetsp:Transcript_2025/g.4514  ORF Transcript_2025/g.4514 Transcript_2025/m.4514 type:complete len:255 (-) Transcript_2025:185-949(-)|eukprot:CEM02418.1 unnamed protein product [Vitrella brassicaformis CCMP3155]